MVKDLQESRALWKILEGSCQKKRLSGRGSKNVFYMSGSSLKEIGRWADPE